MRNIKIDEKLLTEFMQTSVKDKSEFLKTLGKLIIWGINGYDMVTICFNTPWNEFGAFYDNTGNGSSFYIQAIQETSGSWTTYS